MVYVVHGWLNSLYVVCDSITDNGNPKDCAYNSTFQIYAPQSSNQGQSAYIPKLGRLFSRLVRGQTQECKREFVAWAICVVSHEWPASPSPEYLSPFGMINSKFPVVLISITAAAWLW